MPSDTTSQLTAAAEADGADPDEVDADVADGADDDESLLGA